MLAALASLGLAVLSSLLLDNRNGQTTSGSRQFYYAQPAVQAVSVYLLLPYLVTGRTLLYALKRISAADDRLQTPTQKSSSVNVEWPQQPPPNWPTKIINCNCSVDIFTGASVKGRRQRQQLPLERSRLTSIFVVVKIQMSKIKRRKFELNGEEKEKNGELLNFACL